MVRDWEQYIDDVEEESVNLSHLTANQAAKLMKKTKKEPGSTAGTALDDLAAASGYNSGSSKRDDIMLPEMLWQELGMPSQPPEVRRITCLAFTMESGHARRYFRWKYSAAGKAQYLRMQSDLLNVPLMDSLVLLRLFAGRLDGAVVVDIKRNLSRVRAFNAISLMIFAQLLFADSASEAAELHEILQTLMKWLSARHLLDAQIFPAFLQILQNILAYTPPSSSTNFRTADKSKATLSKSSKTPRIDTLTSKLDEINQWYAAGFACEKSILLASCLNSADLRGSLISQQKDSQTSKESDSDSIAAVIYDEDSSDLTFIRPDAVHYACIILSGILTDDIDFLTLFAKPAPSSSSSSTTGTLKIVYLSGQSADAGADIDVRDTFAEYLLQFAACLCCDDRLKLAGSSDLDNAISMLIRHVFVFSDAQTSYSAMINRMAQNLLMPMRASNALLTNTQLFDYFPRSTPLMKRISIGTIQIMVYEALYDLFDLKSDSKQNSLVVSGAKIIPSTRVASVDVLGLQYAVEPLLKQIASVKLWMRPALLTKNDKVASTQTMERTIAVVRQFMLAVHLAMQAVKAVVERADCCESDLESRERTLVPVNEKYGSPFPRDAAEAQVVVDLYDFLNEISKQPLPPPNARSLEDAAEDVLGFLRNYALALQARMRSARYKAVTYLKSSSQ